MKQVLESLDGGAIEVVEVPAPAARPGCVLVRNRYSVISRGTEAGTVRLGRMNLLQKARARPDQVRKVMNVVRTDGVVAAYRAATRNLGMPVALGYSCCGEVIGTGEGVTDLEPGRLVACGGAGWAHHAEIVCVPRNLVVPVPNGVSPRHAAFTTLGAIALQSLRVADVRLGDNVVVIGVGLVGILAVQLLKAAGARVFGIDVSDRRVAFVRDRGLCQAALRGAENLAEQVLSFSHGHGADAVLVTAASDDDDPVRLAGELARHRGRVVVVGRTMMTAPRETYLFKELALRTSLAYGPGTGDAAYEEGGQDYPIGYVRWTENRNMGAFLAAVAGGGIDPEPMITHEFEVDRAADAFALVSSPASEPSLAILLRYPPGGEAAPARRIDLPRREAVGTGSLSVAVIGAGSFATSTLVPALARTPGISLHGIASAGGVRARALGDRYRFRIAASDPGELIDDPRTDGVVILTRHDSHAPLTLRALEAGKSVFVEKPLAMHFAELQSVVEAARRSGRDVQVGFNRRFAPLAAEMKRFFGERRQPMAIVYRANVGYRPPEHWLHDPVQGGGVILGEAVHFIDFCHWLIGAEPVEVRARGVGGGSSGMVAADTVEIGLAFADGSIASIVYLSNGDPALSRERIEAFAEGGSAVLEDFRRLTSSRRGRRRRFRRLQDKGHAAQLAAMAAAWKAGGSAVPLASSALSTLAAILAVKSLATDRAQRVERQLLGL